VRSWLDKLLLGREPVRRAEEADERLRAADADRQKIEADTKVARERLFEAVKRATEEAQRAADAPPPPASLGAAVEELAGDEGINHDDEPDPAPGRLPPARR
jgi:hypothetical protein